MLCLHYQKSTRIIQSRDAGARQQEQENGAARGEAHDLTGGGARGEGGQGAQELVHGEVIGGRAGRDSGAASVRLEAAAICALDGDRSCQPPPVC